MIGVIAATLLEAGDKDLPVYIILPGAFLVPLAVLVVFTFFIRPKSGGSH